MGVSWSGSAVAAPTWLAPIQLSSRSLGSSVRPHVALDAHGDAVAVWARWTEHGGSIEAAFRPAGGTWQAPVTLSTEGTSAQWPSVAFDAQGNAIALWEFSGGGSSGVAAAVRSASDGAWESSVRLSPEGQLASSPELAVNPAGDAMAVWTHPIGSGNSVIEAATRIGHQGAWQPAVDLAAEGQAEAPQIALDSEGKAIAVWQDRSTGYIEAALGSAQSDIWLAPTPVSTAGARSVDSRVAIDPQGDAIAIWTRQLPTSYVVEAAVRPVTTGTWQPPASLSPAGETATEPEVAVDASGDAVVIWEGSSNETEEEIQASSRPAETGQWEGPVTIATGQVSERRIGEFPELAVNALGDVVAAWDQWNGSSYAVEGSARPAGTSAWQAPSPLSSSGPDSYMPDVGIDPQGNAIAAWEVQGNCCFVEAAGYDAAGPLLDGVTIPATGTVGQTLSFSVSPLDVWSAPGQTTWSFGDGTSADGAGVAHTYAEPGSYQLTLTSDDVLGNATSISQMITIAPVSVTPVITNVSQSHRTWREGRGLARVARRRAPVGTTFSFRLNVQSRVTFKFTRRVTGRVVKRKCVARTERNRRHATCRHTKVSGTFSFAAHPGINNVKFQGRLSASRKLAPGTYTLLISATDAAGLHSKTRSLGFRVIR